MSSSSSEILLKIAGGIDSRRWEIGNQLFNAIKPSSCVSESNCPRIGILENGEIAVFNDRQPDAMVTFTQEEWEALRTSIRDGELIVVEQNDNPSINDKSTDDKSAG